MKSIPINEFLLEAGQAVCFGLPSLADFSDPIAYALFVQKHVNWWIGDLYLAGETKYGDDILQVIPEGYSIEHIERCVAVAMSVPPSNRNHNLSWSHHVEVANVDRRLQPILLAKAEDEGWTSQELRKHIATKWRKRRQGQSD